MKTKNGRIIGEPCLSRKFQPNNPENYYINNEY